MKHFYKIENGKLIRGTGYKAPKGFIEYDVKNHPEEFITLLKKENFENIKKQKIKELNDRAQNEIISGFTSNALGSEHLYQSEPTDQLNLIGIVQTAQLTNSNQLFKCSADNGETWNYVEHTPEQLTKVLEDGKRRKQDILIKCAELKAKVLQAQTEEDIKAVSWD